MSYVWCLLFFLPDIIPDKEVILIPPIIASIIVCNSVSNPVLSLWLTLGNKDGYSMLVNDGFRDTVAEVAPT